MVGDHAAGILWLLLATPASFKELVMYAAWQVKITRGFTKECETIIRTKIIHTGEFPDVTGEMGHRAPP